MSYSLLIYFLLFSFSSSFDSSSFSSSRGVNRHLYLYLFMLVDLFSSKKNHLFLLYCSFLFMFFVFIIFSISLRKCSFFSLCVFHSYQDIPIQNDRLALIAVNLFRKLSNKKANRNKKCCRKICFSSSENDPLEPCLAATVFMNLRKKLL